MLVQQVCLNSVKEKTDTCQGAREFPCLTKSFPQPSPIFTESPRCFMPRGKSLFTVFPIQFNHPDNTVGRMEARQFSWATASLCGHTKLRSIVLSWGVMSLDKTWLAMKEGEKWPLDHNQHPLQYNLGGKAGVRAFSKAVDPVKMFTWIVTGLKLVSGL